MPNISKNKYLSVEKHLDCYFCQKKLKSGTCINCLVSEYDKILFNYDEISFYKNIFSKNHPIIIIYFSTNNIYFLDKIKNPTRTINLNKILYTYRFKDEELISLKLILSIKNKLNSNKNFL